MRDGDIWVRREGISFVVIWEKVCMIEERERIKCIKVLSENVKGKCLRKSKDVSVVGVE